MIQQIADSLIYSKIEKHFENIQYFEFKYVWKLYRVCRPTDWSFSIYDVLTDEWWVRLLLPPPQTSHHLILEMSIANQAGTNLDLSNFISIHCTNTILHNPNLPDPMNFVPFGMMKYSLFDIILMSITYI